MKKFITYCFMILGVVLLASLDNMAIAQEVADAERNFHQMLKDKFIDGNPMFMTPVLICLILGLAIVIERIIYLNMATTNNGKLLDEIEGALKSGGVESAKNICRDTKGPVASIFYQGLDRAHEGIDIAEKSVVSYGAVEMGRLERGMIWVSLFISIAPMLGFFGTVVGMVQAFDDIESAGDISPAVVAGGIKVALLTTLAGLLVAIVLQVFYNYLVAKIDNIVSGMEDSSITLIDMLVKNKVN
ncbi:MAG: MotA/TolQ/ExbB proton channel family protein [Bacteroidia bacterium]|nr:MotA/TolQ/ExbB proton channel family protein [Bacteroidia bacterium]NNC86212.1 MotA/TolQ/ExbB proton channel family protein [Bacteroidia bacterium]NNM16400.1 MotA/TolQ/ExbB proton channel family protein [Bacteroidia bacterium]